MREYLFFTTHPKIILSTVLDRIKWNSKPLVGGWPPPPLPQNQGWTRAKNHESRITRITCPWFGGVCNFSYLEIVENMYVCIYGGGGGEGRGGGEGYKFPISSFQDCSLVELALWASDLKCSFTWLLMTKQTPKVQTSVLVNVLYCWNDAVVVKDLINSRKHTCTYFKCC